MLRVGILSKHEPDSDAIQSVIQEYLLHFDFVISGDGPMDLVNGIVKEIFHACFATGIIKQQCSFMCYFNLSLFLETFVFVFVLVHDIRGRLIFAFTFCLLVRFALSNVVAGVKSSCI